MPTYTAAWSLDGIEADNHRDAAHEALRILHDTFAGTDGCPNVFTITDSDKDIIEVVNLADEDSDINKHWAIWPRPAGARFEATLNPVDARALLDTDGNVTLVVRIDQEHYLEGHAMYLSGSGGDDHFNYLHDEVFSFGQPYDPSAEIVGIDGDDFLVEYTTNIATQLTPGSQQ